MNTNWRGTQPADVLFGTTRRRVLGWLYGHPDQAFYLRQIVRQTAAAHGAVQRELATLTRAGLLLRTVEGRQVYFRANREAPIYAELQALLTKTVGAVDVLRRALAPLGTRVRVALVFGSAAGGELRRGSDVDLLVVGEATFQEVVEAVGPSQIELGREVNPTVYPPLEFEVKFRDGNHFLRTVLREPCQFVVGDSRELARLGAERLADGAPDESGGDSRPARSRRSRSRRQPR